MVKVICKRCGQQAEADSFKLHYEHKIMVCPDCFRGKSVVDKKEKEKKIEPVKPAGWDKEDEYLELYKKQKAREQQKVNFKKIPGSDHIKCKCNNCGFVFKYNPFKKIPLCCPYCNEEVPKINWTNMF
jgi:hypothetical protein